MNGSTSSNSPSSPGGDVTRSISVDERRARLARRHHLAPGSPAADVTSLAGALVGLHATDPATVYLSAWARVPGFEVADLERCLYDDLTLVRHLCMRRTLFVLPTDLVTITQAAATDAVAARMRAGLVKELEAEGVAADGSVWLDALGDAVVAAVIERGASTGAELAAAVPLLRTKLSGASPTAAAITPRVITLVAAQGRLARGRPQGSWTSSTHRWRTVPPTPPGPVRDDAIAELARRWLRCFGPAPLGDLVWWSGLGVTELKRALQTVETVEVDLDGQAALLLADDLEPAPPVEPWVALLPSLDPTPMGWKSRDWYLGAHGPRCLRSNRQHRADGLVQRPHRRRLGGAAQHQAAPQHRRGRAVRRHRRRGRHRGDPACRRARTMVGRHVRHASVPHAHRSRAARLSAAPVTGAGLRSRRCTNRSSHAVVPPTCRSNRCHPSSSHSSTQGRRSRWWSSSSSPPATRCRCWRSGTSRA